MKSLQWTVVSTRRFRFFFLSFSLFQKKFSSPSFKTKKVMKRKERYHISDRYKVKRRKLSLCGVCKGSITFQAMPDVCMCVFHEHCIVSHIEHHSLYNPRCPSCKRELKEVRCQYNGKTNYIRFGYCSGMNWWGTTVTQGSPFLYPGWHL